MKLPMIAGVIVFAFSAEGAMAACSAPAASQVRGGDLTTLLSGKTVCAGRGGDRWQEEHHAGGVLKDYKKGSTDKIDPTKQIGTWEVTGSGSNTNVTYRYTGGSTSSYEVWDNKNGSYSFCGPGGMDFTLRPGTGTGCP